MKVPARPLDTQGNCPAVPLSCSDTGEPARVCLQKPTLLINILNLYFSDCFPLPHVKMQIFQPVPDLVHPVSLATLVSNQPPRYFEAGII